MKDQGRGFHSTKGALKKMIADFTNRKNGFFCMQNYTIAKYLKRSTKTIANTISMLKIDNEIEVLYVGKTRYLKLSNARKETLEIVKKFYVGSGTESGSRKGTESGSPIRNNINIIKPKGYSNKHIQTGQGIDIILVNDIKKVITNFKGTKLEEYVCSVRNNDLLRKTLEEYIKNINSDIKNPAGLFRKNVTENLERLKVEKAEAYLEKKCKEQEILKLEEKMQENAKFKKAAQLHEIKLNSWYDNYLKITSDDKQLKDIHNYIYSDRFSYLDEKNKKLIFNTIHKSKNNLDRHNKLLFKDYLSERKVES